MNSNYLSHISDIRQIDAQPGEERCHDLLHKVLRKEELLAVIK